jgi:hypothetical protein
MIGNMQTMSRHMKVAMVGFATIWKCITVRVFRAAWFTRALPAS